MLKSNNTPCIIVKQKGVAMKVRYYDFSVDINIVVKPCGAHTNCEPEDSYPAEAGEFEIETLYDEKGKEFKCDYLKELLEQSDEFNEKVWEVEC